jgi:hypothetical protein
MPGPEGWHPSLVSGPSDEPTVQMDGLPVSGGVSPVFGIWCASQSDASVATLRRRDETGPGRAISVEPA